MGEPVFNYVHVRNFERENCFHDYVYKSMGVDTLE